MDKVRILLVEDDLAILEEIASSLRRRQYDVVTATDFGGGMRALDDEDWHPDVLLTDVNLPDGNGLDLLGHVTRREPPPPRPRVIVMTGHLEANKAEQVQRDGAEEVLFKPFSLGPLLKLLREGARA